MEVDIVGLPGHIVLGIPSLGCHVDVFNGGRVLQREDLAAICNNYGFPLLEEFLTPLSPEETLARMSKNMKNSIRHEEGDGTKTYEILALRLFMVNLIGMTLLESDPTEMILENCHMGLLRRWYRQYGRGVDEDS